MADMFQQLAQIRHWNDILMIDKELSTNLLRIQSKRPTVFLPVVGTIGDLLKSLLQEEILTIYEVRFFHGVGEYTVGSEHQEEELFTTLWEEVQIPFLLFLD